MESNQAAAVMETADPIERVMSRIAGNIAGLSALGSIDDIKAKLERQKARIDFIHDFVRDTFIQGVDFGKADERTDKDSLLKPGAEKICLLFDTHPEWHVDRDTWEMLGKPAQTICLICLIVDNLTGKIIGQGRGAEKIGTKQRDANKAIKIAEKCAIVDAALYTFALSDRFTQDGGSGSKVLLGELKSQLMADIQEKRAGVDSELSDLNWLIVVLQTEIHKKRIDSFGEITMARKAIFELDLYDLKTGKRKGQ
jgi:hypothetical protein